MKYPFLVSSFGSILIFAAFTYVGYRGAAKIAFWHQQSKWFGSLGKEDAQQLRNTSRALLGFDISCLSTRNGGSGLQSNIDSLAAIRSKAPKEIWPIFDLRLAKDYAANARLKEQAGNSTAAMSDERQAAELLRSLGWQDTSDDSLKSIGDNELRLRLKK